MMEFIHHIRYTVRDRDQMVEYIRRNFGLEPVGLRLTDNPERKEALYHIDSGFLTIQISEPLGPEWDIVRQLAEQGPGVYHTEVTALQALPDENFDDDELSEFAGEFEGEDFIHQIVQALSAEQNRIRQAGFVDGAHFSDYVEQVKQLKLEKRHDEAIALLLKLVDAVEAECRAAGDDHSAFPWYYEQLAIIYRKEKRYSDEVAILERHEMQPKPRGAKPGKLATRLLKAKILAGQ